MSSKRLKRNAKKNKRILEAYGFNLIAFSPCIMFEDTFVFETDEEAEQAFNKMEVELEMFQGWWYGKEQFTNVVLKDYPYAEVIWFNKEVQ